MKNNLSRILSVLGLGILFLGCSSLLAQFTDTTAPTLTGLTITPSSIDVSSSAQTVQIDLNVTDDLSGVDLLQTPFYLTTLILASPTGAQQRSLVGSDFHLVSGGTSLNGTWRASLVVPRFVDSGTWRISFVSLKDAVGNTIILGGSELTALGLNPNLAITSTPDLIAPSLTSLSITPSSIDTSTSSQAFTIRIGAQDAVSGINPATDIQNIGVYAGFSSPPGIPPFGYPLYFTTLVSGNAQAGLWEIIIGLPQYSQTGPWPISLLQLRDLAGNVRTYTGAELQTAGFSNLLNVTSVPSDTVGPTLTTYDFGPTFIDTSAGPKNLATTVTLTDDLSGISAAYVNFRSPSGSQFQFSFNSQLISGTPLNGTLTGTVTFPQFSEAGTWKVENLFFYDHVFNYKLLLTSELEALSLPTNLNIILPTLQPDGTISSPATGGTIVDSVFGSRAQITFPPGVLGSSTVVAIDVLNSPLSVPNPNGFLSAASYFVNISLTPHPASFPAPGVTLVLPLVNLMTPGSAISLFRIDPGTGNLVPTPSVVLGQNVVGTVNADGLSATFMGIAQLSVVVAYVPSIQIDITPGKTPNTINPGKGGAISVAIVSTPQFDAATVNPTSVRFGRTGTEATASKYTLVDVDSDGDVDLLLHFQVNQTGILCGDTSTTLTAVTKTGQALRGVDLIKTSGCP